MRINKHDTNGTKPLLGKGELGYDDYVAGGDAGRVYVGTGSENIALAEKSEIDSHAGRTDNPHSVTKAQVGLANVDNTSDANKPISTATQNALNAKVDTSTSQTIGGVKTFSSSPIVPTPTTGTQAANKDYVDTKVDKVTSTDNAIARFDGTTGKLQNSSVIINDNGNLLVGTTTDNGSKLQVSNGNSSLSVSPHPNGVDIVSTGNFAPHYITDFTVYKGAPGSGISKLRIAPITDNLLVGTMTDNGVDKLQVNGSISSGLVRTVSDLNNVTNAGGFLTGDFTFSMPANSPCSYGTLHQIARGTAECTQMVQDIVSNRLFVRSYVGSAWTAWVEK